MRGGRLCVCACVCVRVCGAGGCGAHLPCCRAVPCGDGPWAEIRHQACCHSAALLRTGATPSPRRRSAPSMATLQALELRLLRASDGFGASAAESAPAAGTAAAAAECVCAGAYLAALRAPAARRALGAAASATGDSLEAFLGALEAHSGALTSTARADALVAGAAALLLFLQVRTRDAHAHLASALSTGGGGGRRGGGGAPGASE